MRYCRAALNAGRSSHEKVSSCENCQQQSCKVFIGLTIRARMIGGGRRLLPEILGQTDRVGAKLQIFDLFSLIVPQP